MASTTDLGITEPDDQGIELGRAEADHLARRLCTVLLANAVQDGLIDWELVPNLSERSWDLVVAGVERVARDTRNRSNEMDRTFGIDSCLLMERAQ